MTRNNFDSEKELFLAKFWKDVEYSEDLPDRIADYFIERMKEREGEKNRAVELLRKCEPMLPFHGGAMAVDLVYRTPAQSMRESADRMDYEESVKTEVRQFLLSQDNQSVSHTFKGKDKVLMQGNKVLTTYKHGEPIIYPKPDNQSGCCEKCFGEEPSPSGLSIVDVCYDPECPHCHSKDTNQ